MATPAHRWFLLMALTAPAAPRALPAQSPRTITLRVDNDAFDFWRAPADRTDDEYTSGVRLTISGGDMPLWARPLASALPECVPGARACRTQSWELGQDIYSPARSPDSPAPAAGSRANAGWLYIEESARILRMGRADEIGLAFGVTGPPSLAGSTQDFFHSLAPGFNRPTDWSRQVGFEPGVILQYVHTERIAAGQLGPLGLELLPRVGADAGNVFTGAQAGMRGRAGVNLQHPWLPSSTTAPIEIAVTLGATARAIARDITLDGNTSGTHVGHEPFVYSDEWLLTLHRRWLVLSYGAETDSRAYSRGPASHTWASLIAAISLNF